MLRLAIALLLLVVQGSIQDLTVIDVFSDMENHGRWLSDCQLGYVHDITDWHCPTGNDSIPPESLNGEVGFWSRCDSWCYLTYYVQPNDLSFTARLFQTNGTTRVSWDNQYSSSFSGYGWVNFTLEGGTMAKENITIGTSYNHSLGFSMLDKIFVEHHG